MSEILKWIQAPDITKLQKVSDLPSHLSHYITLYMASHNQVTALFTLQDFQQVQRFSMLDLFGWPF